jgi:hypothetical protein
VNIAHQLPGAVSVHPLDVLCGELRREASLYVFEGDLEDLVVVG